MQKITYTLCGKCSRLKKLMILLLELAKSILLKILLIRHLNVNLNYRNYIKVDKRLFRPNDKIILRANFKKAHKVLKWKPKISFKSLVHEMVDFDTKKQNK